MKKNVKKLYHITTEQEARAAAGAGFYTPAAFEHEGFIHCSWEHQVAATANRIFRGRTHLVVLEIDPGLVGAKIVEENLEGGEILYPHIYGRLPMTAVLATHPLASGDDERFSFLPPPRPGMSRLGKTALLVAAARERESRRPDCLFNDPFAGPLAGDEGRAILAMTETVPRQGGPQAPLENPYLSIRTWYWDKVLLEWAATGIRQVAILAAGMDSRALRLDWPEDTVVFEVDRPEVLEYKDAVLTSLGPAFRTRQITVPIDLREDFGTALKNAGFDPSQPAIFLVEGLLPYLPDEATAVALLLKIAAIAAPGSRIATDMIGKSFLESPWTKPYLDMLESYGAPWRFGNDDPEELFARCGFTVISAAMPGEIAPPGRWPYPVMPRSTPGLPRTFLVTASRP